MWLPLGLSSDDVAAFAAVGAALATVVLAFLTYGYLRATRALARMAQRQTEIATGQLDAQLRPSLVLAEADTGVPVAVLQAPSASARLALTVENVGLGVAVVRRILLEASTPVVRELTGVVLRPGQVRQIALDVSRSEDAAWGRLEDAQRHGAAVASVVYTDVLGREEIVLQVTVKRDVDTWTATTR